MKHALVLVLVACTGGAASHSRAQRIGKLEEAIGGPHAIGRVGDFILENDQVRFVIADTGRCPTPRPPGCIETFGRVNTTFGGTLVDADLQRVAGDGQGNDQLAELLPGFFFTVIDPTSVEVTADGADGHAAAVTVTGTGGDLFEMVALLNTGFVYPQTLQFKQTYKLEPGKRYVTIETSIKNTSSGAHPFPYLDPSQLDDLLGMNIPGIPNLQLSVPMGQLPLFGGEQKIFAPGVSGFNVRFAIEDTYKIAGGFPSFPGMVVDFIATKGNGVSYGLAIPESPDNYVNNYPAGYPMQDITKYSMLLPFTYAGVTGAYQYRPPPVLGPGEERTYTSYFIVGRGDVGSIYDTILELRHEETGTFGGRVVDMQTQQPIARASVVVSQNGKILDQLDTDAGGAFLGHLLPGTYQYTVVTDDRVRSEEQTITIDASHGTGVLVQLQPAATLVVSAVDELDRHAPAKIELVGHDARIKAGTDGRGILYSLQLGEDVRPTAFDGSDRYIEKAWWTSDGRIEAKVKPGDYELVVSRGPEYEATTVPVTLAAGSFTAKQVQLARSFSTDGWVAGDFHIHAQPSTDSGLAIDQRVKSCAAEGLEVAVATDHNFITDYAPVIASSGLDPWLLGVPGMELTTFEAGHFIGFPLRVDPGSTRGGEFRWAHQPPKELFNVLRSLAIDDNNVVSIAHPRQQVLGYFAQYFIDAATGEPYTPTGIIGVFAPYGDEFQAQAFSYDFDALELLTGRHFEDVHTYRAANGSIVVGKDGRPTFPGTVETWFTMLDRGHKATGMGASDSHRLIGDEPGDARTLLYVGAGKDTPGGFSRGDVVSAVRGHHAVTTNAPFVEMSIAGQGIGSTVTSSGPTEVTIRVRAPSWGAVDHLTLYMNSAVVADMPIVDGTNFQTTVTVTPTTDSWIVAEVSGKQNMFPVVTPTEFPPLDATIVLGALSAGLDLSTLPIASSDKPSRTHISTPYAITNPIWIDRDGNGWTPPKQPLPARVAPASSRPDVRAVFDALPEITP